MNVSVNLKPIRYVGQKATKTSETVIPNSGVLWHGHGDVQWVPEAFAIILVRHPLIWELATDVEAETPPGGGLSEIARRAKSALPPTDPKARGQVNVVPRSTHALPPSDPKAQEASLDASTIGVEDPLDPVRSAAEAQQRIEEVIQAIPKLKPKKDFTSGGLPSGHALSKILKRTVTREERDAAWTVVCAELAKQRGEAPPELIQSTGDDDAASDAAADAVIDVVTGSTEDNGTPPDEQKPAASLE